MKHFFNRFFAGIAFFVGFPIIITLLIQGSGKNFFINSQDINQEQQKPEGVREEILLGIVANEIPMETEVEAMKAQAVIARTNCLRALEKGEDFPEGLTKGEMIRMWGQENFSGYYSRLESCIEATRGVVMTYNGTFIRAEFHKVSAGYTRDGEEMYGTKEFPYLKKVDSRADILSEDFLKVVFCTPEEFVNKGGEFFESENLKEGEEKSAAKLLEMISSIQKDTAGYVKEVTIGGKTYSGEEFRLAYGLNSSAFSFKEVDGEIRVVTKGLGHGLGLSLYGANQLAKEGMDYKDILKHFYHEIEFVTQSN